MTQQAPAAPARAVRLLVPPTPATPAVLELTDDGEAALYTAVELPSDAPDARVWEVIGVRPKDAGTESAARRYQVLVRRPRPGAPPLGDCTCPGGSFRGHVKACRHLSALTALWAGGHL